jgi:8-oxo-dGTP pyrophosphatase MutT (NUDIX family)
VSRALDLAFRLRRRLWALLRLRTRGVKVMLFDPEGALLLVRHGYGRSDLYLLPGGGIQMFEPPERAARREIREELGCGVDGLVLVSTHFSAAEGKRDTVHLFTARPVGAPKPDGFELIEARFFPLDALPAATSPATLRRIDEHLGRRVADGRW